MTVGVQIKKIVNNILLHRIGISISVPWHIDIDRGVRGGQSRCARQRGVGCLVHQYLRPAEEALALDHAGDGRFQCAPVARAHGDGVADLRAQVGEQVVGDDDIVPGQLRGERAVGGIAEDRRAGQRELGGVNRADDEELCVAALVERLRTFLHHRGVVFDLAFRLQGIEVAELVGGERQEVAAHRDVAAVALAHVARQAIVDHVADELQ